MISGASACKYGLCMGMQGSNQGPLGVWVKRKENVFEATGTAVIQAIGTAVTTSSMGCRIGWRRALNETLFPRSANNRLDVSGLESQIRLLLKTLAYSAVYDMCRCTKG